MLGGLIAKANLNPVNAIHSWISGGSTTQNLNAGTGKETQMRQVVAHLVGQVDAFYHACAAYFRVT